MSGMKTISDCGLRIADCSVRSSETPRVSHERRCATGLLAPALGRSRDSRRDGTNCPHRAAASAQTRKLLHLTCTGLAKEEISRIRTNRVAPTSQAVKPARRDSRRDGIVFARVCAGRFPGAVPSSANKASHAFPSVATLSQDSGGLFKRPASRRASGSDPDPAAVSLSNASGSKSTALSWGASRCVDGARSHHLSNAGGPGIGCARECLAVLVRSHPFPNATDDRRFS